MDRNTDFHVLTGNIIVVPYVGTWIEIEDINFSLITDADVVPYVGTWIEIQTI